MHQNREGDVLADIARTLFPHAVPDAVYEGAAAQVRARMQASPALAALLESGLAELGEGFGALDEAAQAAALRKVERTRFFASLRQLVMFAVYNHPAVWALMGYEGSAMEKGGYLERGFDDIDWLPKE